MDGTKPSVIGLDDSVLRDAVERIVAEFRPVRIVLFGSRAWGRPHAESDYDLLVLVHGEGDTMRASGRMSLALRDLPAAFDVLVRPAARWRAWSDTPLTLENRIEREGKNLYAAD